MNLLLWFFRRKVQRCLRYYHLPEAPHPLSKHH